MKNRILSLILAAFMSVSMLNVAFAAEEVAPDRGIDEAKLLLSLGILYEYNEEPLNYGALTTRAEFVSMVAKMLRGNEIGYNVSEAASGKSYTVETTETLIASSFHDVTILHWGYEEIEYLRKIGLLKGYDNGYFYPDEPITLSEAAKLLVKATGYDFMAEAQGGYPDGFMALAKKLKITDGVAKGRDEYIVNSDSYILIYNTLHTNALSVNSVTGDYHVVSDGFSIMNEFFGVYEIEGTVTGNHISGLYGADGMLDEGYISIGDRTFKTSTDMSSYLGHKVTAYVAYSDETKERGILLSLESDEKEESIKIKIEDVIDFEEYGNTYRLKAYVGEDEVTLKINQDADVLYNGAAYGKELTEDSFDFEIGSVTLVKSSGNYYLVKIENYMPFYVKSISYEDKSLRGYAYREGTGVKEEIVSLSDDDINVFYYSKENSPLSIEEINEESVIYLAYGEESLYVTVSGDIYNGNITSVRKDKVYLDGYEYETLSNVADYRTKSYVKVGLTKEQKIFYVEETDNAIKELSYGLLMDVDTEMDFEETFFVRLMDNDGKISVYTFAENMKLTDGDGNVKRYNGDGKNTITSSEIKALLEDSAKYAGFGASAASGGNISAYRKYEQVVKYAVNGDGEISEFVIAKKSTSVPFGEDKDDYFTVENVEVADYASGDIYQGRIPNTPYSVGSSLCFNVSKETTAKPQDTDYGVKAIGNEGYGIGHGIVMFDVDKTGKAGCVITGTAWGKNSVNQEHNNINRVFAGREEVVFDRNEEVVEGYEFTFVSGTTKEIARATLYNGESYDYLVNDYNYKVGDVLNPVWWSSGYLYGVYDGIYHPVADFINAIAAYNDTDALSGAFHNVKGDVIASSYEYEEVFGPVRYADKSNVVIGYGRNYVESISSGIPKSVIRYDCETGYIKVVDSSAIKEGDWAFMQLSYHGYKMLMVFANTECADVDNIKDVNEWK